ncbi:hypothetical protein JW979_01075 [bacterium]|nr:hypothetical protein [candidate division CSSED10-310 bacterium]
MMKDLIFSGIAICIALILMPGVACLQAESSDSPGSLSAVHESLDNTDSCKSCHNSDFSTSDEKCFSCHQKIKQRVESSHGIHAGISDCGSCHPEHRGKEASLRSKDIAIQSHSTRGFVLSGGHLSVPCAECHRNDVFKGTPDACEACHWMRRQDDPYETKLGIHCGECHNTISWIPANWNHQIETGFGLYGNHIALACDECHEKLKFTGKSPECISCHHSEYNGTDDPDHKRAAFPKECWICHDTSSWRVARFDHSITGFPLTGAHRFTECSACHPNGRYQGTPIECYACHKDDYENAQDPDHAGSNFPKDCSRCHSTHSWTGFDYNHAVTGFPLQGVHRTLPCQSCHKNGRFKGTPDQCNACHAIRQQ